MIFPNVSMQAFESVFRRFFQLEIIENSEIKYATF